LCRVSRGSPAAQMASRCWRRVAIFAAFGRTLTKRRFHASMGDAVIRDLAGGTMLLRVTDVTPSEIHCGYWIFSRRTGAEIDAYLGWDETNTGSIIRPALGKSPP